MGPPIGVASGSSREGSAGAMDAMDDDPFDAVLALEERFHERGLAEGRREGVRRGREQGRALVRPQLSAVV